MQAYNQFATRWSLAMLPLRLILHNFLAYADPNPINLAGLNVVVLCGQNGAGKSSLLDAITWALWRASRVGKAMADEGLIREGQRDMSVTLELSQDDLIYRVRRTLKLEKRNRTTQTVELSVHDPTTGDWNVISGDNIHETNEKITSTLKLDYDTFVNSAYFQQGKADSFATQTASERIKLLSEILNLDQWDTYLNGAKAKLKALNYERETLNNRVEAEKAELEFEGQYRADLDAAESELAAREQERDACKTDLDALRQAETQLQNVMKRIEDYRNYIRDAERRKAEAEKSALQSEREAVEGESLLERADEIMAELSELDEAEAQYESLGALREEYLRIDEEMRRQTAEIGAERKRLKDQHDVLDPLIMKCDKIIQTSRRDQAEQVKLTRELETVTQGKQRRVELQNVLSQAEKQSATAQSEVQQLEKEGKSIRVSLDQIKDGDGVCPTCQRPFAEHEGADIQAHYESERERVAALYRERRDLVKALGLTVEQTRAELAQLDKQANSESAILGRLSKIEAAAAAAGQAEIERQELETERRRLFDLVEYQQHSPEAREQHAALSAERDALGYDVETHRALRTRIAELKPVRAQAQQIEIARKTVPLMQKSAAEQRNAVQVEQSHIDTYSSERDMAQAESEIYRKQVAALKTSEQQYNAAQIAANQAREKRSVARQKLERLDTIREKITASLDKDRELADQISVYTELEQAFGKNGIPHMIIESAVPELETMTNRILHKMTDGRLSVWIKAQMTNRGGDVRNTLEIDISDELGTRNYDLYSGGEAFRINFALRIALSKFLARRAGARLQALFIDEGFGSQDADGRERLAEAINAVSDEFKLILIVTHIEELIEMFPARLEVTKTPEGSQVRVR